MWLSIQIVLIVIAVAVILVYLTGYGYIFNGISKTYFKGKLSANIDDGPYFQSNRVAAASPKPWEKAPEYNTYTLPQDLMQDLEFSRTASFLVVKNGKLVHEQYWNGYHAESSTNSFSMAKAVTVMLLGKALEEQKISSIDEKFSAFFGEFDQKEYGKELTLKHLARMESGLDWEENYKNPFLPNAKAYYGRSLISATFPRKFKEQPGSRFEYQSGSTQLLGFAVQKAINQTLSAYLSEKFWTPLGMEHPASWSTDESGMEKTYCCIHSNARDFAKLGQLFLDNGKAGEKQILNEDFIEQMRTPTEHSGHIYGMGLWINHDNPVKHYYFLGLQGQYIIMVPEYDMVIVRTGSYHNLPKNDRGRPDQVKFLVNTAVALFE
ncbi:serine hydrolase domain-containing protein [Chryseobacterium camelliae]|uniref:serine hydrolase domain-containing protein n=1 Tax=Chryseobacterium camelliae TaxID=1265445 RepID=UPI002860ABF3|nr:serine hydrolase [Chryseobacterium camelliae]MDR6516073.1 CubicO group peptidase (beta-lactamase class C family) [Chryseobacterium camelliae]